MKRFHGIPWNLECGHFDDTISSMEFHGSSEKLECASYDDTSSSMKFYGIPWNVECASVVDNGSSMEFHGTWCAPVSMTRAVPWNSMQFHGTWSARITMTPGAPWNYMELGVRPILITRAVPWNSMELGVRKFRWHEHSHTILFFFCTRNVGQFWVRFLSLAGCKLRLCSANHRSGYWSNLPCDWTSTAWANSLQETEIGPWYQG